ncbi:hypothetical protein AYK21_04870 [Thermoplasmatales archaeon SG8-52-2]|nr:MAG: hypothetical protein AYK21_04870 [Thermoplasmatales archaeon SG8-52-2]
MGIPRLFSIIQRETKSECKNNSTISNIDKLVDSLLDNLEIKSKKSINFYNIKRLSFKKSISIIISFILLFAVIASASSLIDNDVNSFTTDGGNLDNENLLFSNTTIPGTNSTEISDNNNTSSINQNNSIIISNESVNQQNSSIIQNDFNETNNKSNPIQDQGFITEGNDTIIPIEKSDFGIAEKTIYNNENPNSELTNRRTLYSKTYQNNDGSYQKRIGVGPIHYFDENGNLDDINTNFVISNDLNFDYEVNRGFYKVKLNAFSDSPNLVEYNIGDSFFIIELQDLYWGQDNGDKELISIPLHSEGIIQGNKILYSNAYGEGNDVEFIYHPQYFGKNLILNSIPSQISGNDFSYLQFNFKMTLSDNIVVYIDGKELGNNEIITQGQIEFREKNTNEVQFFFNEPYSKDSQDNKFPISLSLIRNGSEILISKLISKDWLNQAVYPINADADTIYLEADIYDMYDNGGNHDDDDIVQIGRSGGQRWDGYWAFPITGDIINGSINYVTFTGYVTQNDMGTAPVMYGLQQENCPALEGTEDPSTYSRTTNSYTWNEINGGGSGSSFTTGDIKNIFNEWIDDYTHNNNTDRFGIVLDDAGAWNNREVFFYDYSHSSYSDHTYLTIDYLAAPDNDPPTPNPLTWSTEPYETSSSSITMVATIASDETPPISYFFNETTGNSGGTDSSWQSGDYNYTDNGLSENTQYGYEVKSRDSNTTPNEGSYSTPISYEYTDVDPPTNEEISFSGNVTWINATVAQPPNPTSDSTGSYFNWITGGADNSGWQNGIYYHNRTGLSENTEYGCQVRYRNGDADASNYNPAEQTVYTYCNPPTDGEFSIDSHGINWMNMSVANPPNPTSGSTAAYFECITGGALDSGWITDSSSGRYYYNASGLSGGTTYGFRVKYRNGDGVDTSYTSEKQDTTDVGSVAPTVVTNASKGIEETNATLVGWLQNNGTADTTCYILWGVQNPPTDNNISKGIIANGAEFVHDTSITGALTKGMLYYVDTKAVNNQGWDESGGVKAFLTKPDPPNSLTAQANTSTMIYLSWLNDDAANTTYIERNTVSSWARGNGIEVYNGSSTKYEDNGVSDGITYYYQAWSYANWTYNPTLHQWSDSYESVNVKTNTLPIITDEVPANESTGVSITPQMSITVNDLEGDLMNINWYSNSEGSWQIFARDKSVSNGTYYQINSNFSAFSTIYYWYISVSSSTGTNDSDIYYFTTETLVSSVDKISPYSYGVAQSPLNITATGSSGLDQVTLYYRWSDDNQSWDSWELLSFDSFEGVTFDWGNYTDGGYDCFEYTGGTYAHDGSNAVEISDNSGDSSSFYYTHSIDVHNPDHKCIKIDFWFYAVGMGTDHDFFVEYYDGNTWQQVATYVQGIDFVNGQFYNKIVWINETDYTFPIDMKIKFRCDAATNNEHVYIDEIYVSATTQSAGGDGIDWTFWSDSYNPDENSPWSWDFDFPKGTGYYEFYSIGNKSGSPDESAPGSADAMCYYNATLDETIVITPGYWNQGTLSIGASNETTGFYFNLTNQGNVLLNIQIKATNATNSTTGAKWVLNTTQDFDNYTLEYNRSDTGTWTNIALDYNTFITNLAVGSWQTFDIKLTTASTSTKGDPLSITVTFRSVAV